MSADLKAALKAAGAKADEEHQGRVSQRNLSAAATANVRPTDGLGKGPVSNHTKQIAQTKSLANKRTAAWVSGTSWGSLTLSLHSLPDGLKAALKAAGEKADREEARRLQNQDSNMSNLHSPVPNATEAWKDPEQP